MRFPKDIPPKDRLPSIGLPHHSTPLHTCPCRSFAGESLERERFQLHVRSSYRAGLLFASAKALFEATNRGAIHASLLALYRWVGADRI